MRFRRNAPIVLIAAVAVVVTTTALLSNYLFSGLTAAIEDSQFKQMQAILAFNLRGAENRALARAELLADLPSVREKFAAKSRDGLIAECAEMFRVQKEKHGVDQFNFHLATGIAFLRLQAPTMHGDDLSKFRFLVMAALKEKVSRTGLEIARTGPAVFGVVPMEDIFGQPIGAVEVGIDAGGVLDGLKAAYGLELALFVEEQPLKEHAKGINPEVLSDENRFAKYLKVHSTNWGLLQNLVSAQDLSDVGDGSQYVREAVGVPYGVLLVPLRSGTGTPLGVMAIAQNFSSSRAAAGRSAVWQGALALAAIVLLAGAILVVLRGFLLRPLGVINERFAALAGGDRDARIEDPETFCAELQELSEQHEKLRTQSPPAAEKPAAPATSESAGGA